MKPKKFLASVVKNASENDEERILTVIACDPSVDRDFEKFDTGTLQIPLKGGQTAIARKLTEDSELDLPAFIDHGRSVNDQIGSVISAKLIEEDKLELKIKLLEDDPNADKVYKLAKGGHLGNSVSVSYGFIEDSDYVDEKYVNCELLEVSIVWKGSNRNAQITSVKKLSEKDDMPTKKSAKEVADSLKVIGEAAKTIAEAATEAVENLDADDSEDQTDESNDSGNQNSDNQEKSTEIATEKDAETDGTPEENKTDGQPEKSEKQTKEKSLENKKGELMPVKTPVKALQDSTPKAAGTNRLDFKRNAMKSFVAQREKNFPAANEFATKAVERLGYKDGKDAEILLSEEVDRDVMKLVENMGGILAKVTKKRISGPLYKKIIRETVARFQPVPYGTKKATAKPGFTNFKAQPMPWALIYTWDEELAEDTIFNLYDEMIQELAEGYIKTAEYIIFKFDGKAADGTDLTGDNGDYRITGLEVIPGIPTQAATYDKTILSSLTSGVSKAKNAGGNITLAMNTTTLGKIGVIQKENGDLLFDNQNNKISLGLLGAVDIEINDMVSDDKIILGNYSKYLLIERNALQIKYSDQASVDGVSLYETDGEAVRGRARLDGNPVLKDAFCIISLTAAATTKLSTK